MFSPKKFLSALCRTRGYRPSLAGAPVHLRDAQLQDQLALGLIHFVAGDANHAGRLVESVVARRQRLRVVGACRREATLAVPSITEALARGSCLLALPFSGSAIELLRELSRDELLPLILIESPAVRVLSSELPLAARPLPGIATKDVIGHVKASAAEGRRNVYVSFPELHALGQGTTAPVSFLGKPCRFSLLDPLLCTYGVDTIITLSPDDHSGGELRLVSWDAAACRGTEQGKSIRIGLEWLYGHIQAAAAAAPADTLSWQHLYRASFHFHKIERDSQLEQLVAYFNAWKGSPAGIPESVYDFVIGRIASLRDAK